MNGTYREAVEALRREIAEYASEHTPRQASERYEVDHSAVSRWCKKFGIDLSHHNRPLAPCGTRAAYVRHLRHGERCDECREANNAAQRADKANRKLRLDAGEQPPGGHGNIHTYNNWMCRCDECREAWSDEMRRRAQRRRAASA